MERHGAGSHVGAAALLCLFGPTGIGRTAFALPWPPPSAAASGASPWLASRSRRRSTESPACPDAAPGRLVDALRRLGPLPRRAGDNPLLLLGELDLLDEAAADALLGALDPARRRAFWDRYVGLPLDLRSNRACASSATASTRSAVERYGCGPRVSRCPGRSDGRRWPRGDPRGRRAARRRGEPPPRPRVAARHRDGRRRSGP